MHSERRIVRYSALDPAAAVAWFGGTLVFRQRPQSICLALLAQVDPARGAIGTCVAWETGCFGISSPCAIIIDRGRNRYLFVWGRYAERIQLTDRRLPACGRFQCAITVVARGRCGNDARSNTSGRATPRCCRTQPLDRAMASGIVQRAERQNLVALAAHDDQDARGQWLPTQQWQDREQIPDSHLVGTVIVGQRSGCGYERSFQDASSPSEDLQLEARQTSRSLSRRSRRGRRSYDQAVARGRRYDQAVAPGAALLRGGCVVDADLVLAAAEQIADVAAVAIEQQQGDHHLHAHKRRVRPKPPDKDRRQGHRYQRRGRRDLQHLGDEQPDRCHAKPHRPIQTELHPQRRCDAFAAAKSEKHRIQVPNERGKPHSGQRPRAGTERMCHEHRQQALDAVTKQRNAGGLFRLGAADAQYIGCARIVRALGARVRQAHEATDENSAGDRA